MVDDVNDAQLAKWGITDQFDRKKIVKKLEKLTGVKHVGLHVHCDVM